MNLEKPNPNKNPRYIVDDVLEEYGLITKSQKQAKQAQRKMKEAKR